MKVDYSTRRPYPSGRSQGHELKILENKIRGPIHIGVDLSGFYRGIELTQRRVDQTKRAIALRLIPFYKRIILRTPVWRGTARLNWYFNVDGKYNRSGNRWGGSNKGLFDPKLEVIANKVEGVGGFVSPSSAEKFVTQNPKKRGFPMFQSAYSIKKRVGVPSQTQYGMMTRSVQEMLDAAERNVERHFKITGGEGTRRGTVSKISITNHLPYIRFLEGGNSPLGALYASNNKIWGEKTFSSNFVSGLNASASAGGAPESLGGYKQGYINRTIGKLRGEILRLYDKDQRSFHKSLRGRMVGYIK